MCLPYVYTYYVPIILTTLLSVTSGFGSVIHIEYVDFVPELGRQFQSLNL